MGSTFSCPRVLLMSIEELATSSCGCGCSEDVAPVGGGGCANIGLIVICVEVDPLRFRFSPEILKSSDPSALG
ncbi:hypothetical protein HanPSC8_Chr06g0243261 [Helianthus annuus]|nr:hypothetical protein HanPSC8_Chr06g0243261 [Helianthus annuus]